ncbi:response regulator [Flavobacterium alkalisoli]|uniref:Response regulator n=1 Tax=Flavobacterium alkalisoli TaxID=2602769 RepID=A0A5B9FT12_9FLAO|nr:LytTR family transcriptional regulator DNA-binding domain-containing protein [Flavobacterium alkalisoli]QEE49319.1 response regulator [Flavobacterium alkalisoli]
MQYSYLIIDEDISAKDTLAQLEGFPEYFCAGVASSKDEAVNKILELQPSLVFLEVSPKNKKSQLSLSIITELHQYIDTLPYFVVTTSNTKFAYDAIKAGVSDYLLKPLNHFELRKALLRFEKTSPAASRDTICIKSYGDYQFISLNDIVYLKADNNTTDFYLQNGKKLTAYKTLKHYESNLPFFFFRIHNSYIVNSNYISRINTGKALCYLNNSDVSISFSKTFKDNIDAIIRKVAPENL